MCSQSIGQFPTLTINLSSRRKAGVYTVELELTRPTTATDQPPEEGKATIEVDALRQASVSPQLHGELLTKGLFADQNLRDFFNTSLAIAQANAKPYRLVLRIHANAPELHSLRWETLCNPKTGAFLVSDANLRWSREIFSSDWEEIILRPKGELRVLLAVANPADLKGGIHLLDQYLAEVDVQGELKRAQAALVGVGQVDNLSSPDGGPWQVTLENLAARLRQGYDILYLVCHGALLPEDPYDPDSPQKPYLLLERSDGRRNRLDGDELVEQVANLESSRRPRLVVLASCQSGGQGDPESAASNDRGALAALGPKLAEAGVPAVIAMQGNIKMKTVEKFMPVFFEELMKDGQLERAMALARSAVRAAQLDDWWAPVLYTRLKDGWLWTGEIFDIDENVIPLQTAEQAPQYFVGRQADIEALIDQLRLDAPPEDPKDVVAIHGMPGVGKTALMNALAYHPKVKAALPDGVLRAELGPEPDVMTNQLVWARELGEDISGYPNPEARKMRLLTLCSKKKALLILDNVWQTDAARYLFVGGPACRTLVATRNIEVATALAVRETYRLQPLSDEASLELLRNLAPDAFELEPVAMKELGIRLSGLPLALDIAGQTIDWVWRNGGDVGKVLADLQDREARLTMITPDDELEGGEKQSLRAVLQVSYERLPDEVRKRAFRLLGAFDYQPAIFDLSAANAIWQLPPSQAQKTILILASRGLLKPVGEGRYSLHAVLADFAASLLDSSGPDQCQAAKHCQAIYYLGIARHYRKEDYDKWLKLDKDWYNLWAAANWISKRVLDNKGDLTDLRLAAIYAICLESVIQNRKIQEAGKWLQAGILACSQLGRVESQAWLNLTLGSISLDQGYLDEATAQFQESADLFAKIPNPKGLSYAHGNLGIVERVRGDYDKALAAYEQVLEICLNNDDRRGAAYAYYNMGDVLRTLKDRSAGREKLEECIKLCRQENRMTSLLILALSLLAELNLMDGRIEPARNQAGEAQKIAKSSSSDHLLGIAERAQAGVSAALEKHDAACVQFSESLRLLEQAGVHEELAETHEVFANYLNRIGNKSASRQHYHAAIKIFNEIGAHAREEELLRKMEKL